MGIATGQFVDTARAADGLRTADHPRIANRCPACGHQSLFIGAGGWLTCSWLECRNPDVDCALAQARVDIIHASQLQHEVGEARREALAMRDERDREIAARKAIERGASIELAHLLFGIREARRDQ